MRRLFLAAPWFLFVACSAAPVSVRGRDGLQVEQVARRAESGRSELALRLRAAGSIAGVRHVAVLESVAPDGERREVARAPIEVEPSDRVPTLRGHVATVSFALPAGATAPFEVRLVPGR